MTIRVNLDATARVDIDLNENAVSDVIQNYNGDFEEWAKSNYHDYMDFNDFDVDFDDCDYNEDEAKKLILRAKDVLGLDEDFNIDKVIAHRTALGRFIADTPTIEDDLEILKIDIDLVAKAIDYTDFKNPKFELNYIHLDKNTISATDTRKLIHITNHKYTDFDNVLFPPCFIEPLQNGAELYENSNGFIYMKYNKQWFLSDLCESWKGVNFPEVKRILLSEEGYKNKVIIPFKKFTSNSITQKYEADTYPKELIKYEIDGFTGMIREIYYNDVVKVHNEIDDVYIDGNLPLHFIGENMQIVVMPIVM